MVACVVVFSFDARRAAPCRHVTKIPSPQLLLFHTLTNRDASNPLECPLTKTVGSHPSTQTFFSLSVLPWPHVSRLPYLPSSVSRNCFACPSHKNNGGGGGILPVSEFFARHSLSSSPFFSDCSTLFCAFLHFFALLKKSTRFFSNASPLFAKKQKTQEWLCPRRTSHRSKRIARTPRTAFS